MDSTVTYDPIAQSIGFKVKVAGKEVPCLVTQEWLLDAYGPVALEQGAFETFKQKRAAIEALALRQWLASRGVEPVALKRKHVWRQAQPSEARSAPLRPTEKA